MQGLKDSFPQELDKTEMTTVVQFPPAYVKNEI